MLAFFFVQPKTKPFSLLDWIAVAGYYAFVQAKDIGVECNGQGVGELVRKAMLTKHAIMKNVPLSHPFEPDLQFLYGVIVVG